MKELIQYKGESMKLEDQSFLWNCLEEMNSFVEMLNQVDSIDWFYCSIRLWKQRIELCSIRFYCLKETIRIITCTTPAFSRAICPFISFLRATAKRKSRKERIASFSPIKKLEQ